MGSKNTVRKLSAAEREAMAADREWTLREDREGLSRREVDELEREIKALRNRNVQVGFLDDNDVVVIAANGNVIKLY